MKIIDAVKGFSIGETVNIKGFANPVPAKVLGFRANAGFEYLYVQVTDAFTGHSAFSMVRPHQVTRSSLAYPQ